MKSKIVLISKDLIKELVIKGLEADHVISDLQKDEIDRFLEHIIKGEWITNMRLQIKE